MWSANSTQQYSTDNAQKCVQKVSISSTQREAEQNFQNTVSGKYLIIFAFW